MNDEIKFYRASGKYGWMSNLFPAKIYFEKKVFSSSEAAYQYGKPKNKKIAEWIISAPKQHLIALAGHMLLGFDIIPEWSKIKIDRMRKCLFAKFTQHSDLKQKLINTKNAKIIENSKTDAFWGIGKNGKGKNMLGNLLMELRKELQNENKY